MLLRLRWLQWWLLRLLLLKLLYLLRWLLHLLLLVHLSLHLLLLLDLFFRHDPGLLGSNLHSSLPRGLLVLQGPLQQLEAGALHVRLASQAGVVRGRGRGQLLVLLLQLWSICRGRGRLTHNSNT